MSSRKRSLEDVVKELGESNPVSSSNKKTKLLNVLSKNRMGSRQFWPEVMSYDMYLFHQANQSVKEP